MPKWLIILLVVLLVVILGCCGGMATCGFIARRAGGVARSAAQAATQRMEEEIRHQEELAKQRMEEARQRVDEEVRKQAEQAARGGSTTPPEDGSSKTPAAGGTTAPPRGSPVTVGGGAGQPTVSVGGTSLPSNFPKDVPVMTGFAPGGMSVSDSVKGSGMTMLSGKASRQDLSTYYQKQMKDQGWTLAQNLDMGELTMMTFTKDKRQVIMQATTDNGTTSLVITYEQKP
jgi:hypothetical protein